MWEYLYQTAAPWFSVVILVSPVNLRDRRRRADLADGDVKVATNQSIRRMAMGLVRTT